MKSFLQRVAVDRASGQKPSAVRAFTAAAVAGVATAGITYKVLRA